MRIFGRFSTEPSKAARRLAEDIELLHNSRLVDPVWYRETYADLRDTPVDVARHYLEHGAAEGRNPGPLFDTKFYLKHNPDVAASGMNPLVHYILHGAKQPTQQAQQNTGGSPVSVISTAAPDVRVLAPEARPVRASAGFVEEPGIRPPTLVSIIIPVHNRIDLTVPCLDSIYRCAVGNLATELIVIDDASTDGTAECIREQYPDVKLIQNARRQSFGANMNAAAKLAKGRHLCLLNNDTIVLPNWLGLMVEAAENDPTIGVVGNRHLWPDSEKINHGGMAFDKRYEPVHIRVGQEPDFAPALVDREFQILTAACWVVPRHVFDDLGGFDLQFKNGFEDVDFCLRVRERGLKVWYVGKSVIYHYGQSTPGRTVNDAENARRFHQKWRGKIVPDLHKFTAIPPWRAPYRIGASSVTKSEADIHFAIPLNTGNAFTWVTVQLALACEKAGMKVSLPPNEMHGSIEPEQQIALKRMTSRKASSKFQIRWGHYWKSYLMQPLAGEINAEIFAINYRYGRQATQSLDMWMRHTVMNPYRKLPISQYCSEMLTDLGVEQQACRVVPHGFSPEILLSNKIDSRFQDYEFVFLGVTNSHDPLRYGTDILLKSYQQAFAGRKDVLLVLKDYGSIRGPVESWIASASKAAPVIQLKEFVSKEDLIALYRRADAFVAPFRGEGFGMKIADACAVGLPVIAPHYGGPRDYLQDGSFYPVKHKETPVGDCLDAEEGIVPPYALWCEPDIEDLANQMIAVSNEKQRAREVGANARKFVLENFSWEKSAASLSEAFADFSRQRDIAVSPRAAVLSKSMSVVIPTFRRPDALRKTLEAYRRQTQNKNDWEMIVVDDGSGPEFNVAQIAQEFAQSLPLRFVPNAVNSGPGKARETAIPMTIGDIVLITGDDIVPHEDLISEHLSAHRGLRCEKAAVLGYIAWDKGLKVSELMDFITGDGGHQFSYFAMDAYQEVSGDFFYTSNVSIRRQFLTTQETIFDPHFSIAACEDSELGLRLVRQGMKLYFNPDALAFHNHDMSDEHIYRRQYNVGRALVTYCLLQPQIVDEARSRRVELLELLQDARRSARSSRPTKTQDGSFTSTFERLGLTFDDWEILTERLREALPVRSRRMRELAASATRDSAAARNRVFALRLELAELCGMADAWLAEADAPVTHSLCASFLHQRLLNGDHVSPLSETRPKQREEFVELLTDQSLQELAEGQDNGADLMKLVQVAHYCDFRKDGIWYVIEPNTNDPQLWLKPTKPFADKISIIIATAAERKTNLKIYWRYGQDEFTEDRAASFGIGPAARIIRWIHGVERKDWLQLRIDPAEDICGLQFRGSINVGRPAGQTQRLEAG
jgi:GT2 family glycosyltransferase/glycosyltransferase involved in cell wall biosynthesis